MDTSTELIDRTERRREYQRRYIERHPERRKASLQKYNNSEEVIAKRKKWITEHLEQYKASKRKYNNKNKEKIKEIVDKYRKDNPGWMSFHCAKRRSNKLQATPSWSNLDQIKLIYQKAKEFSQRLGVQLIVDHVIPLNGKTVCGLHVPDNLQLLTKELNSEKSNKFED